MTFGEKLSSLRKNAKMTQQDLANELQVSRQVISKWESGVGLPDIDNLTKIASKFNVKIDDLLDYKIEDIQFDFDIKEEVIDKKNSKMKNVNNFILQKFADADSIEGLTRVGMKLTFWQGVADFFIGAGIVDCLDILRTGLVYPFLITKGDNEYLASVSKDKLLTKKLKEKFTKKIMVVDGYKYSRYRNNKLK